MNDNDGKFSTGFMLGLIVGGGAVFLLGTKTGKNLLKIVSEQGFDGLANLLAEYDISDLDEDNYVSEEEIHESNEDSSSNGHKQEAPKKRFFRRIKK